MIRPYPFAMVEPVHSQQPDEVSARHARIRSPRLPRMYFLDTYGLPLEMPASAAGPPAGTPTPGVGAVGCGGTPMGPGAPPPAGAGAPPPCTCSPAPGAGEPISVRMPGATTGPPP